LSLITEHDIELIHNIESLTKKKLVEYEGVSENEVLKIWDKVNLAKRVANMNLIDTNFGEKKLINKNKMLNLTNQSQRNTMKQFFDKRKIIKHIKIDPLKEIKERKQNKKK